MMKVDGIGKEEKLKIERRRVVKVERKKEEEEAEEKNLCSPSRFVVVVGYCKQKLGR